MKSQKSTRESTAKEHRSTTIDGTALSSLKSLLSNKAFAKYRTTLERIYNFYESSEEKVRKLKRKCSETNNILEEEKKKLAAAISSRQENEKLIENLRSEVERTRNAFEEAKEQEQKTSRLDSRNSEDKGEQDERELSKQIQILEEDIKLFQIQLQDKKEQEQIWKIEKAELIKRIAKQDALLEAQKALEKTREKKEKEIVKMKTLLEQQSLKLHNHEDKRLSKSSSCTSIHSLKFNKEQQIERKKIRQLEDKLQENNEKINKLICENEIKSKKLIEAQKEEQSLEEELEKIKKDLADREDSETFEGMVLNKKYVNLKQQFEEQQDRLDEKTTALENALETEKQMEEANNKQIQERENLQDLLQKKDQEQHHLHQQISEISEQTKKYFVMIKQLEKTRDSYINEIATLEEQLQILHVKVSSFQRSDYTKQFFIPNWKALSDKNYYSTTLPGEHSEPQINMNKSLPTQQSIAEQRHRADTVEQSLDSEVVAVSQMKHVEQESMRLEEIKALEENRKHLQESLNKAKECNEKLLYDKEIACETLAMLKEKIQLEEELLNRIKRKGKQRKNFSKHLRVGVSSLRRATKLRNGTTSDATEAKMETFHQSKHSEEIEELKEIIRNLEQTVSDKTKETDAKTECIRGQFQTIEQLKKCICTFSMDGEKKKFEKRLSEQNDMVKSLKDKVGQYESYIRDSQVEVDRLNRKLSQRSRLQNREERNSFQNSSLQVKKLHVNNSMNNLRVAPRK